MQLSKVTKRILLVVGLVVAIGGGVQWYFWQHKTAVLVQTGPIYDFDDARDTQDILTLFEANWHWLTASPDTSPAYLLKHRSPDQSPLSHGKLSIKVLREHGVFIGFIAYYKRKPQEGFILFVAIKEEFRGKHYAEKLIRFAIDDMREQGAKSVWLVTRLSNARAQALYTRLGFYELQHDDVFIYFQKDLK